MTLDIKRTRNYLQDLDYKALFNELGWSQPRNSKPVPMTIQNVSYTRREIAQLSGVPIFEMVAEDGKIPDANMRKAVHKEIAAQFHEHLLIFLDAARSQSMWYWVKREGAREYTRDHLYVKGQPGDLALGKLGAMVFDVGDFDESGRAPDVLGVVKRLKDALDVERVTKRFYEDFKKEHERFLDCIQGIENDRDRRWYTSALLNRLMFIYFLQRKLFLANGDGKYLQNKLAQSRARGPDRYYREFLSCLFFEGFAQPEGERSETAKQLLGKIVYLNGGLFLRHPIEQRWPDIQVPDEAFERLFELFSRYSWNLDDTPNGDDNEISPHVLGYIFEKYINQKSFGAYYTCPEITNYLCEHTINELILEKINTPGIEGVTKARDFATIDELLTNLDAPLCRALLDMLPKLSILDPACGSGAFLVSAMNTLTKIYGAITGKIEYLRDSYLTGWLQEARTMHRSLAYYIKKKIITENLFGVDIMEEATEIARLRLFLALVSSVQTVEQLEPLPNIDFNILFGNSLIGLLHVNENRLSQLNLLQKPYYQVVEEKDRLINQYKHTSTYAKDLRTLRDIIQDHRKEAIANLNELLLDEFKQLVVKYEQATWDSSKQTDGKPLKRMLKFGDVADLRPFHWGYEFNQVMETRGGFDIIITNPPWEIFKPQAKEFFAEHSDLISKNKMRIEDFEHEQAKLLQNTEIREKWLAYQSRFPHQSAYFRAAPQYANQISTVNGKKSGTDINLYKLFTEQCYNLLRAGGHCGIVIPSGIYTDLGAKQLRELLFSQTHITGLFCFENRKAIFEGVDSRFKFAVLTFEKGGRTATFPATFMRHDVAELEHFPRTGALEIAVELVRQLSPDSLSVMEFKHQTDVDIAQKTLKAPLLGEKPRVEWKFVLTNEFHMTNDSYLFKTGRSSDDQPLYEGKMVHQFTHRFSEPRYWIDSQQGRSELMRREMRRVEVEFDALAILQGSINNAPTRQERVAAFLKTLACPPLTLTDVRIAPDMPRLVCRSIARNTDERTMIATILPPHVFAGNSLNYLVPWHFNAEKVLVGPRGISECYEPALPPLTLAYLCGVLNSFTLDYLLRSKVSANVNMFYLYQLPVPRLTPDDSRCTAIATRVARLICVGSEFDELRRELLGDVNACVATDDVERRQLRSEIDGLVAHLYELTEEEFRHTLHAFPLVEQPVKDAALGAYHKFALEPDNLALAEMIAGGENERVEFKEAACWNVRLNRKDETMKENVLQEVAAFLNSKEGGTVLIGVADDKTVIGLQGDYAAANPQKQNQDGYSLFLADMLKNALSGHWSQHYKVSFGMVQGKEVCRIEVQGASEAVFLKSGDFYVREGNRKRKLTAHEAIMYIRQRWG